MSDDDIVVRLRRRLHHNGGVKVLDIKADVIDAADELDRLRAEVERMRPVIEAAVAWRDTSWGNPGAVVIASAELDDAIATYVEAVAALDAGEPAGE